MGIDIKRITERLDSLFDEDKFDECASLLDYWMKEAQAEKDYRAALAITSEQMGLYRKIRKKEKAMYAVKYGFELVDLLNIGRTVSAATVYLNCATVYSSFGDISNALYCYYLALDIYSSALDGNDTRLATLYNNMAVCLSSDEQYEKALEFFEKAIEIMKARTDDRSVLELAVTYVNLCDMFNDSISDEVEKEEKTDFCLSTAYEILKRDNIEKNGYYAFVCDKCIPAFAHYGYASYEYKLRKLRDTAKENVLCRD